MPRSEGLEPGGPQGSGQDPFPLDAVPAGRSVVVFDAGGIVGEIHRAMHGGMFGEINHAGDSASTWRTLAKFLSSRAHMQILGIFGAAREILSRSLFWPMPSPVVGAAPKSIACLALKPCMISMGARWCLAEGP